MLAWTLATALEVGWPVTAPRPQVPYTRRTGVGIQQCFVRSIGGRNENVHRRRRVLAKTATALPNGAGSASLNGAGEALSVWHTCRTRQRWTPRTGLHALIDRVPRTTRIFLLGSPRSQNSAPSPIRPKGTRNSG